MQRYPHNLIDPLSFINQIRILHSLMFKKRKRIEACKLKACMDTIIGNKDSPIYIPYLEHTLERFGGHENSSIYNLCLRD